MSQHAEQDRAAPRYWVIQDQRPRKKLISAASSGTARQARPIHRGEQHQRGTDRKHGAAGRRLRRARCPASSISTSTAAVAQAEAELLTSGTRLIVTMQPEISSAAELRAEGAESGWRA
jgi:hypothetical protein